RANNEIEVIVQICRHQFGAPVSMEIAKVLQFTLLGMDLVANLREYRHIIVARLPVLDPPLRLTDRAPQFFPVDGHRRWPPIPRTAHSKRRERNPPPPSTSSPISQGRYSGRLLILHAYDRQSLRARRPARGDAPFLKKVRGAA